MRKLDALLLIGAGLLTAQPTSAQDTADHLHHQSAPPTDADAQALQVELAYTADLWSARRGGTTRDARYLDNFDLTVAADLDRLAGIPRTSAFAYVLYNNGARFSDGVTDDAQVISNIETGTRALRLYEAWIEHGGASGRWSLRAGLYDLNSEFDAMESSDLFLGSAHGIGTDISQSGANGPSIFPSTSLALRGDARIGDRLTLRAAILDAVPGDPDRPSRTVVRLGRREGALGIAELDWDLGSARAIAGAWGYSRGQPDLRDEALLQPRRRASVGAYLRGESVLAKGADTQLRGFVRVGVAAARANPFGAFASAGLNATGLIPGRGDDETGVAIAHARSGRTSRAALRDQGLSPARAETAIELTHRFSLSEWLSVQPDLQYVISPGALAGTRNVLAAGLRVALSTGFGR